MVFTPAVVIKSWQQKLHDFLRNNQTMLRLFLWHRDNCEALVLHNEYRPTKSFCNIIMTKGVWFSIALTETVIQLLL